MTSVSQAVETIIKGDLVVYDALKLGVINNKALARHIQKDVEILAKTKTTETAVAMAIQRLSKKISEKEVAATSYAEIFAGSRLQLRDDIHILYLAETPFLPKIDKAFSVVIEGIEFTTIFIDEKNLPKLGIPEKLILGQRGNLSAIILASPKEITETPGVIAHLMNALGANNINVVEVTSSYDNTFIIVDKKDSLEAIQVIRSLLERSRKK